MAGTGCVANRESECIVSVAWIVPGRVDMKASWLPGPGKLPLEGLWR